MANEEIKTCQECGATIYPEHIESGRAGLWSGKLMCPVCLNDKKSESAVAAGTLGAEDESESISLVDEKEMEGSDGTRVIQAMGAGGLGEQAKHDDSKYGRKLNKTGQGATRVRIFHTKMNDGASAYMSTLINEWLDESPKIEVKFVETTVGVWEGKHAEPNLILTIWY